MDKETRVRSRRKMQSVTMADVAKLANVSPSTVSLYLRRPKEVSQRIGKIVSAAIDELGYMPSFVAGGLAAARVRVVSIIVPSMRNAFFSETIDRIESLLAVHDLQALVGHTNYDLARETTLVRASLSWSPAGLILTGMDHSAATIDILRKSQVPVVQMWDIGPEPIDVTVGFSHFEVGRAQARHLVSRGSRNLAFFGARIHDDTRAARRRDGFICEADASGRLATVFLDPRPASTAAGADMLATALSQGVQIDAIACSNDFLALGVTFEAQRRGLRIPDDLSLIGFGDMEFSASCLPSLTTIRLPAADISRYAVDMILGARQDRVAEARVMDLQFQLVPRQSA